MALSSYFYLTYIFNFISLRFYMFPLSCFPSLFLLSSFARSSLNISLTKALFISYLTHIIYQQIFLSFIDSFINITEMVGMFNSPAQHFPRALA